MSDISKKVTPRIRTFAGDLDEHRQNRGESGDSLPDSKKLETKPESSENEIHVEKPRPVIKPIKEEHIVVSDKPTPQSKKQIPSFHELQKKVSKIQAEPASKKHNKKGTPGKTASPIRTNIGFDATVITDTKKNKTNPISAIATSLHVWFKAVTKPRKKKTPKYVIPEASHRKGVIQKATTKSGSIFTADNDTLKEQIRRRQQEKETREDEPETTWSPFTDSGFNLLEAPDVVQNVKFEYKKRTAPASIPPLPTPKPEKEDVFGIEELISARQNLDKTTPPVEEKLVAPLSQEAPVVEEAPTPIEEQTVSEEQLADEILYEDEVDEQKPEQVLPHQRKFADSDSLFEKTDTNTLTVITLIAIIGLVILVIVSRLLFQFISGNVSPNSQESTPVENVLQNSYLEKIIINNGTAQLLANHASDGTTEIAFVISEGGEAKPSDVFNLLEFSVSPPLKQSITSVRFISTNDNDKLLLLKFVDETTVKGGLLAWEKTLAKDVTKIFNLPTNIPVEFTDSKVSGHDARVLIHNDKTILIYSIIDENTALISNSHSAVSKIAETGFSK